MTWALRGDVQHTSLLWKQRVNPPAYGQQPVPVLDCSTNDNDNDGDNVLPM